ncbi:MAG: acetyltransferase, partial [Frankiales bacterium]|nr:acetyltransferase [Frankiales bacterium]
EPLHRLFGSGNLLALYGVYTFFIISGFLITSSFLHRSSTGNFLARRCLRIFPGLVLCLVLSVLVLGPLMTSLRTSDYLGSDGTAAYAARTVALVDTSDQGLPGVLFSSNDYGTILNGSQWTLGPEFICYLGVIALGLLFLLRPIGALALLGLGVWTHLHPSTGFLGNLEYLLPFFAAGSALYFLLPRLGNRRLAGLVSLVGLVAVTAWWEPAVAFALFGSVLVLLVGTSTTRTFSGATRFGDLSYGIYLYGWPVEQTVRHVLGDHADWWSVFLVSLLIAAALAFVSWHLVEARAMRLGQQLSALSAQQRDEPTAAPAAVVVKDPGVLANDRSG